MTLAGLLDGAGLTLAVAAFGSGARAARLWWQGSRVPIDPTWAESFRPVDPIQAEEGWLTGMLQAIQTSGGLNARAAVLSAVSVGAAGAQSLVSWFAAHLGS